MTQIAGQTVHTAGFVVRRMKFVALGSKAPVFIPNGAENSQLIFLFWVPLWPQHIMVTKKKTRQVSTGKVGRSTTSRVVSCCVSIYFR